MLLYGTAQRFIAVYHSQRRKAQVYLSVKLAFQHFGDIICRSFDIVRIYHRRNVLMLFRRLGQTIQHFAKPDIAPCHNSADGHLQLFFQSFDIHLYLLFLRFVKKIYADKHIGGYLHCLQNKIQVPFKTGSVADHYHRIGLFKKYIVPCGFLFCGMSQQGICSGQISQYVTLSVMNAKSLGSGNGLSRPVSRMLIKPRKGIEYC